MSGYVYPIVMTIASKHIFETRLPALTYSGRLPLPLREEGYTFLGVPSTFDAGPAVSRTVGESGPLWDSLEALFPIFADAQSASRINSSSK